MMMKVVHNLNYMNIIYNQKYSTLKTKLPRVRPLFWCLSSHTIHTCVKVYMVYIITNVIINYYVNL